MPPDHPPDLIRINLNGTEVTTAPGRLLIDLAEALGIFIPRFCYHPRMKPVGMCRMCLVEVEGSRKLLPACATPVTDGMVVRTDSPPSVEAQKAVLELLLINHPLDCPICDRGGECPLQDQALSFGPGASRYREQKRHFKKALPLSQLVTLDRERCVLCWRCVRFCREVSGDKEIELLDRGSLSQINTGPAAPFDSHFSGNTIQICPVGALTATPYRFQSRPWDLLSTATVCSFCAVGCPLSIERRGQEVLRAQALPNDEVNGFWNCDKGRYGHRYVSHADRLRAPLIRRTGPDGADSFEEAPWVEALDTVTEALRSTIERYGPEAVGFIGGSHATNEDLYAAHLLFREAVGTPNLDFRTFDATFDYGAFGEHGVVGSTARISDLDKAQTILWFGADPKEELPVLYLRLRQAVRKGAKLLVAHPRRISLCEFGTHLAFTPGREAELVRALATGSSGADCGVGGEAMMAAGRALSDERIVLCAGPQSPGAHVPEALRAFAAWAAGLEQTGRASLLLCVPNANSQGALDFGIYPGLGPGQRSAAPGLGTLEMLSAAVSEEIRFLWILGADVLSDVPDAALAEAALRSGAFLVVSELFPTRTALSADVVLPAASFAEKEGSFTNLERRIQKTNPLVAAPGGARADWQVFLDIATRLGHSHSLNSEIDIAGEIARSVATHAGFNWNLLGDPWSPVSGPSDMPPQLWHAAGESGSLPSRGLEVSLEGSNSPLHLPEARPTTAWPLRWELRAVDATRRRGWVWPLAWVDAPGGVDAIPSAPRTGGGPEAVPGAPKTTTGPTLVPQSLVGAGESPPGSASSPPPGALNQPAGSLVLLLGRFIYDDGAMVSRAPDLRGVTPAAFVELHPQEAQARGLQEGAEVTVSSGQGSVRAALRCSPDTPRGAVFLPYDQPGMHANVLLDSLQAVTFVEVTA
ncbi:MAG: hypothetical protein NVSMB32_00210 [Actinomycetota bacterium]